MENKIACDLIKLGLIDEKRLEKFSARVRDRDDIGVLRDTETGIIFLDRSDHMDMAHYESIEGGSYWGAKDRAEALEKYREDDERRAKQFHDLIVGKDVIDVGCGTGGFMDQIKRASHSISGIEPQEYVRKELITLGYEMYRVPEEAPESRFDIATLFHVLEHITDPLETLAATRKLLRPGGKIVIEVPHARDVLFSLDSFKQFSLWSEHFILHTKESLRAFLQAGGFKNIEIQGFQRYPLANHIGWLVSGEPGGQKKFPALRSTDIERTYERILIEAHKTDTLIAYAEA
ncbi:MAG TPA: class I SAM-dependent methyltransferase [Candidatus Paceibacterota bacterium]|nr:class I SAM-dependent methyltransferase [Candidatus Paceibacterota bacterium]